MISWRALGRGIGALALLAVMDAAPVAAQQYNWSGLYFGGSVGGLWGDLGYHRSIPAYGAAFNTQFDHSLEAAVHGGHVGYQAQHGHLVFGLEASLHGGRLNSYLTGEMPSGALYEAADVRWYHTITARLGYALDARRMLYVRGGYAGAMVETGSFRLDIPDGTGPNAHYESGWTIGAGLEYRLMHGVLLGLAYDYTSIDVDHRTAVMGVGGETVTVRGGDLSFHTVNARLSFLLGRPVAAAPAHQPLK